MANVDNPKLAKVYGAQTPAEQRDAYDAWASDYERDVFEFGIRIQANAAAAFVAHVPDKTGPFLDAACGTGLQIEPLRLLGYGPFTGIDLSERMLDVARDKELYVSLQQATLGERLPFDDGEFAAALCIGAMSPGHAPPESFEELARVTRPDGRIVVSLRTDEGIDVYTAAIDDHVRAGTLAIEYRSAPFASMPLADASIQHAIYVLTVTSC